ncbi:MAG TPA: carboxypeptidase-like regulatory domain-containing protein, partial [Gemmatimonadaceae bacterium]|nr:carboxypeptidase-like regulatory domain-containing protein [Gemmatimonadaceae bacterium]
SSASTTVTATVDSSGRYHLASLPPGRYMVQVSHPTLDSLEVTLPPGEVVIFARQSTRADYSLPTGEELRDIVCPGLSLGREKAVIAGRVIDAETRAPLAGTHVVAAWTELAVDGKTKQVVSQGKQAVVETGQAGEYRLCGIPATTSIELQLQHDGRASVATKVSVTPAEGAVVRDFSLSVASAPTIAALDSLDRRAAATPSDARTGKDSPREEVLLKGTASVAGIVRTTSGAPLPGAEVRVRHAESSTLTDAYGRFVLGDLPAGTQLLLVRRLGYALAEHVLDLRSDRRLEVIVRMTRAVELDSVRVLASRAKLAEFEYNRKTNLQGRFMTLADIQRTKAKKTSELIPLLGGYVMMGRGRRVPMRETDYDPPGTHPCREANVVIDGVDGQAVDDVLPVQIAGIELYKNAAAAPLEYAGRANCGLIVIWLRPGPRWRREKTSAGTPPASHYTAYP